MDLNGSLTQLRSLATNGIPANLKSCCLHCFIFLFSTYSIFFLQMPIQCSKLLSQQTSSICVCNHHRGTLTHVTYQQLHGLIDVHGDNIPHLSPIGTYLQQPLPGQTLLSPAAATGSDALVSSTSSSRYRVRRSFLQYLQQPLQGQPLLSPAADTGSDAPVSSSRYRVRRSCLYSTSSSRYRVRRTMSASHQQIIWRILMQRLWLRPAFECGPDGGRFITPGRQQALFRMLLNS